MSGNLEVIKVEVELDCCLRTVEQVILFEPDSTVISSEYLGDMSDSRLNFIKAFGNEVVRTRTADGFVI